MKINRSKALNILKKISIVFFCGLIFFVLSYAYLSHNIDNKKGSEVYQKELKIPYEHTPESRGVSFVFEDRSAVLVYLDFYSRNISLYNIEEFTSENNYGKFTSDYTVWVNNTLIEGIVDRVGGVTIETNGKTLRYTGVQIADMLSQDVNREMRQEILLQIFKQISKNDFQKDDFIFIIENTETDLSLVEGIYWLGYIKEMSLNTEFVN